MLKSPLRTGPDIDWRSKCHPGDNQGETDACTVFAIANWVECVLDRQISDGEAIELWRAESEFRHGPALGGLQITEAFAAAYRAGWLPTGTQLRRVGNLQTLPLAPLIAGMENIDWDRGTHDSGFLYSIQGNVSTRHAVVVVSWLSDLVFVENSHGPSWGQQGFGCIADVVFAAHCSQLWQIILPGSPRTLDEAQRQQLAPLVHQIRDQVTSLARNLNTLGYNLPGDGKAIMGDVVRRSLAGQLTDAQQDARRDVTDVYLILTGSGITDDQINAVWEVIK